MSKSVFRCFAHRLFFIALLLFLLRGEACAQDEGYRVLLLNSYHSNFVWTAEVTDGIRQTLLSSGSEVEFLTEYMDTKRGFSVDALKAFSGYMERKYSGRSFDLLICSDDDALVFLRRMGKRLFPDVPVIFCGVNSTSLYEPEAYPHITGLFENVDISGTAELALRLFPRTSALALVSDLSTTGMTVISQARSELAFLGDRVRIHDLFAFSEEELQDALSALPPETVLLMLVYFQDEQGNFISPSRSVALVKDACVFPLFGLWSMMPEAGAFGGSVLQARRHGEKAAEIALRVLAGVPPSAIPAETDTEYVPMFDFGELKRFRLSRSDLGQSSVVLNEPERISSGSWKIIIINAVVVLASIGYVALLLVNERRRKRAAKEIALRKSMWEGLFRNAPDAYVVFGDDNTVLNVNEKFCEVFGYEYSEAIGRDIDSLVAKGTDAEEEAAEISRKVLNGEAVYSEGVRRKKDGNTIHVGIQGVLFPVPEGCALGYGIYSDISERRRNEEEMNRRLLSEAAISSISARLLKESGLIGIPPSLEEMASFTGAKEGFLIEFSTTGEIVRELLFSEGRAVWSASPHISEVFPESDLRTITQFLWEKGRLLLDDRLPAPLCEVDRLWELKRLFGAPLLILPVYSERMVSGWLGLQLPESPLLSSHESFLGMFCDLVGGVLLQQKRRSMTSERARILDGTSRGIVEILGRTLAMKDPYTVGHQFEVARLARAMAERGGYDEAFLERVYYAGLVHDLGKIVIPSSILSKPGRLNTVEFEIIKNHALHGWEILSSTEFPWPLADIVVQHHERLDGSGYPYGLKGAEIRTEARFIAVADVVEAMTSHRPYRPGLGIERALEEIRTHSGTWFDPLVVELCLAVIQEGFVFDDKSYKVALP